MPSPLGAKALQREKHTGPVAAPDAYKWAQMCSKPKNI